MYVEVRERVVMAHLLQMGPLGPDVLDPLSDLWGAEVSLSDQGLTRGNAVAQGAIAGGHLVSEGLVLAEQVEGGGEVAAAVAAGKDLLLLPDPGRLLAQVPKELPEAARVFQTLPALGGQLAQLLVGLTQQLHLLADQPRLARFIGWRFERTLLCYSTVDRSNIVFFWQEMEFL